MLGSALPRSGALRKFQRGDSACAERRRSDAPVNNPAASRQDRIVRRQVSGRFRGTFFDLFGPSVIRERPRGARRGFPLAATPTCELICQGLALARGHPAGYILPVKTAVISRASGSCGFSPSELEPSAEQPVLTAHDEHPRTVSHLQSGQGNPRSNAYGRGVSPPLQSLPDAFSGIGRSPYESSLAAAFPAPVGTHQSGTPLAVSSGLMAVPPLVKSVYGERAET